MKFADAYEWLKAGEKIKCPEWAGYWVLKEGIVEIHTFDGKILNMNGESDDMMYTLSFTTRDDWEIADIGEPSLTPMKMMNFGEALRRLKLGKKMARTGWNGKGMFVVYQKGYPEGIPCNKQTAEAWGMQEGDLFRCNPYLQIRCVDGSHSMWVPSINDILSNDWIEVMNITEG